MSMFNMGGAVQTAGIATNNSGNFLKAGIHKVVFKGIEQVEGAEAMILKFETPDGAQVHNERVFSPRNAERGESQYGPTPSEFEQFLSKCKCIIKALDKELFDKIEKDGSRFSAPDFTGFVALLKKYLDKKVGTEVDIKLIPTQGQYVGFPGFPARISKDGNLYIANNFIGENLTLTAAEVRKIEAAATATPTDMSKKTDNSDLAGMLDDFETPSSEDDEDPDGLPF